MRQTAPLNRRGLLIGGLSLSAFAAAGLARGGPGRGQASFSVPKPNGKRMIDDVFGFGTRKEAHGLTAESDDVRMYREAVGWMKKRSEANPLDPIGWAQHWAHHSLFCATTSFSNQVHYGWFFLPWHRAYLFNLEQKIRRVLNEPAFALPYWDWTKNPALPQWYWGEDNPLSNTTRLQEPGDVMPADFLEIGPILRARTFRHFGGRKRTPGDLQVEGTLEQSAHNNVHNWTGGEMASFDGAGNDPVFQSHHGQIDRIWDIWLKQGEGRSNPDDPEWLERAFWFYGLNGTPEFSFVCEVLKTKNLGYDFDDLSIGSALTEDNTPTYDGDGLDFGTLDPGGAMLARLNDLRETMAAGRPGRVSLTYERMSLPVHPFCHRLFFVDDRPGGSATYVGTFTILPIPDLEQGLERKVSSQVEVPPDALNMLIASKSVRVVGVGVPLKGRTIPTQPIPFEGVSLSIDG